MVLHLHRAERADTLVAALGRMLSSPLDDPFAIEIVCVPTPGVERWMSQSLAHQLGTGGFEDGVCIGVDFPSPRRLIRRIVTAVAPDAPEEDPWDPQRAVWPLLRVIDASRGEEWAALLWAYLGDRGSGSDPVRAGRRWSTARRLTELFARYAAVRPQMIARWRSGCDGDADGAPLPAHRVWQAELWRRLRAELDAPDPVEQLAAVAEQLRSRSTTLELPERLSLFGATRLDPQHVQILAALAREREVHLWLPHPSPILWSAMAEDPLPPARLREADRSDARVEHRLLGYLGRDSRELQLTLAAATADHPPVHRHHPGPPTTDTSVLARLQADLADNRRLGDPERPVLDPDDDSITFHASHGPDRQVEVLREILVGLLADDPTLEPRDIVVMCPDIERFAPLVASTFGLDTAESEAEHPGHRLRVRLADRSLRQVNPLLAVVSRLVGLAEARVTAEALLDLCALAPVSRRFGFRAEDLDRLHALVGAAGIRWGLDDAHRARFGMGGFRQNTWAAGIDRLLLGVAMDETDEHFIGTTLPLDDVDSSDVELVGRLAECLARITAVVQDCQRRHPVETWMELFKRALAELTSVSPVDGWQLSHAYATLSRLAADAEVDAPTGGGPVELALAEVAALLADAFRGRPTRANFRTGTLTMCTMLPMRSVPHRVVCLLGLDDGVFPRAARPDGDDLTVDHPWVGDRDPRSEDRQLLLDAITSARERLVVVYAGMDPRSGKALAPAVPISELRHAVDGTVRGPEGGAASALTVEHPLQPFDARNFAPGLVRRGRTLSFDRAALRAVQIAARPRTPVAPLRLRLPAVDAGWQPTLADLMRFFSHPLKALLRDRAQLSSWPDPVPDEQIPIELNGLDQWAIGDRLLRQHLRGQPLESLVAAEWRRGSLPPRAFGQRTIDEVASQVRQVATIAATAVTTTPDRHEIAVDIAGDRFTGSIGEVHGDRIVRISYSALSAKARLHGWIELLALTAAYPDRSWQAEVIGRRGRSVLGPVPGRWAELVLADLIEVQRIGLSEPIPFAVRSSAEYAEKRFRNRSLEQFRGLLEKTWKMDHDRYYQDFFGPDGGLDAILADRSIPAEERGDFGEPSRFGTLARRVFQLMLSSEVLG